MRVKLRVPIKRYFWFSYHAPPSELAVFSRHNAKGDLPLAYQLSLHKVRDGAAFAEIAGAIQALGYSYGGLRINLPTVIEIPRKRKDRSSPSEESSDWITLGEHDGDQNATDLRREDLLVLPTRPPLDDHEGTPKKVIHRSCTRLEETVHSVLRRFFFRDCSRASISLTDPLVEKLPKSYKKGPLTFRQFGVASLGKTDDTSLAFLSFNRTIRPGGPSLLTAFGMGGLETLVWTQWLRTHGSELLQDVLASKADARFVMARFEIPTGEDVPTTLRFAKDCEVSIELNVPLPDPRGGHGN